MDELKRVLKISEDSFQFFFQLQFRIQYCHDDYFITKMCSPAVDVQLEKDISTF